MSSCVSTGNRDINIDYKPISFYKVPTSLSAKAIVALSSNKIKGRANIFVQSPDLFRIEVLGPFDKLMALMISDGEQFSMFDGRDFRIYDLTQEINPLKFKPEEIVSFLTGSFKNKEALEGYEIILDKNGFIFHIDKMIDDKVALSAVLSNYKEVEESLIPYSVLINLGEEELLINYKTVDINPEPQENIFTHPNL